MSSEPLSKNTAPIKNTAGEGFDVETAVVAWLACHLLAGMNWPTSASGTMRTLHCQMRQDGWGFDDIVIAISNPSGDFKIGCSIKSFPVFGPEGAPLDFAKSVWKEWDGGDSPFRRGEDHLALFASAHTSAISETWKSLLDAARVMSAETLARRMAEETEPSPAKRMAFASMLNPQATAAPAPSDQEETARVLSCLSLVEHDFDHTESRSTAHAISLCQQALVDSARERAAELWEAVLCIAAEFRKKGGMLDLPRLLARTAHRFPLKQHPSYAAEWEVMRTVSADLMEVVPAKIGGLVTLERREMLNSITEATKKGRCIVLLGRSGYGKTVLARSWASGNALATPLWIRSTDLTAPGGLRVHWSLRHSIAEILANAAKEVRMVIDGLDRCFDDAAFAEIALLIKAATQPVAHDRCQLVVSCRPDDWERVRRHLFRHGIAADFAPVLVGQLERKELDEIGRQIPALSLLLPRRHLDPLLLWPKALDMVALHWRSSDAQPDWTTESDFARWFWQSAIAVDEAISIRSRTACKLGVMLADSQIAAVKLSEFTETEMAAVRELQRERHLEVDEVRQTVRFTHDLIADYARLRELLAQDEVAADFLRPRLHSPLWHRATRLFGLDLLEQHSDSNRWQRFFSQFPGSNPADEVAQNLLLEAPIFALHQRSVLDQLWPVLEVEGGKLLRRLLRQFLRVATVPDERMLSYYREAAPDGLLEAAAVCRQPYYIYWPGLLSFLNAHKDAVVSVAREEVSDICLLWLPLARVTDMGMSDAAGLAVASARKFYRSEERRYKRGSKLVNVCKALLAAAAVLPDQATELCFKLSGRRKPHPDDGVTDDATECHTSSRQRSGTLRPWPDGPCTSPAPAFCEAFFDGSAAEPFLYGLPEVAEEVMFATLLDIPRDGETRHDSYSLDEHGFRRGEEMFRTLFWTSGPFLSFLRVRPEVALPAIIRLVNFGTDRALELPQEYRQPHVIEVVVDEESRAWHGHQHSYYWHRGHVFGPRAVCCALMSLERWLYLLMDGEHPFEEYLITILRESRSIALGAVLIAVGKRKPELFLGVLRPLLASSEFHWLEDLAKLETGGYAGPLWNESEFIRKAWSDWVQMPHRKEVLSQLALRMFFSNLEWRSTMDAIRNEWQNRINASTEANPAPRWLSRLAAQFTLSNWQLQPSESSTLIVFEPPSDLPKLSPQEEENLHRCEKLTILPFQCRQILEGEKESTEAQITEWWSELSGIRNLEVPDGEMGIHNVEDAVCGILAVAVVHHRAWVEAEPHRKDLVLGILREILANPPSRSWLDTNDNSFHKWDYFAASAITPLWVESPMEPFLREAVAVLAMGERYLVVERVMQVAAAHRRKLGSHFDQLLSLTVRYSQVRHIVAMGDSQEKAFDLESWITEELNAFLSDDTELLPAEWAEIRDAMPGHFCWGTQSNSFDISHLNAALAWAADLNKAENENERSRWFELHRQSLLVCLYRMECWARLEKEEGVDVGDSPRKFPYQNEQSLLENTGRILARLRPGEPHDLLWKPILALGADAPHWITSFVSGWFLEAAGHDEPAPAFIEQWSSMLDFAESCDAWTKQNSYRDMEQYWKYLLGISPFTQSFWDERLAPAVAVVRSHFEKWVRTRADDQYTVCGIIAFLGTKAAGSLQQDALVWLREEVSLSDQYFWNEKSVKDAFAGFLRLLFDEHWDAIFASVIMREAFMAFALKLAALQHPLGSEILELAGQRLGGVSRSDQITKSPRPPALSDDNPKSPEA